MKMFIKIFICFEIYIGNGYKLNVIWCEDNMYMFWNVILIYIYIVVD